MATSRKNCSQELDKWRRGAIMDTGPRRGARKFSGYVFPGDGERAKAGKNSPGAISSGECGPHGVRETAGARETGLADLGQRRDERPNAPRITAEAAGFLPDGGRDRRRIRARVRSLGETEKTDAFGPARQMSPESARAFSKKYASARISPGTQLTKQ